MKFFKMVMFTKEGKGIEKDEPQKRAFFRFWEQVWQKRFKLVAINFLYVVGNIIPLLLSAVSYFTAVSLYFTLTSHEKTLIQMLTDSPDAMNMFVMGLVFVMVLFTSIPVFAAGPFQAGFTYILKSFVKREPVFLWHDYITKTKSNFALSMKVCIINIIVGFIIMIDIAAYLALSVQNVLPSWMLFLAFFVVMFSTLLFLVMNMYIYPMIVIFKINLKQLYKNSMMFAVLKWLPNLGILAINVALPLIPLLFIEGYFAFYITLFLYLGFSVAFKGFLNNFYVYPNIKKFMIDNPVADESKTSAIQNNTPQDTQEDFDDTTEDN